MADAVVAVTSVVEIDRAVVIVDNAVVHLSAEIGVEVALVRVHLIHARPYDAGKVVAVHDRNRTRPVTASVMAQVAAAPLVVVVVVAV